MRGKDVLTNTAEAELERPPFSIRFGWDAWNAKGDFLTRATSEAAMWKRNPSYFRVNSSGLVYAVISRERTAEIPAGAIRWRNKRERSPLGRKGVSKNQLKL